MFSSRVVSLAAAAVLLVSLPLVAAEKPFDEPPTPMRTSAPNYPTQLKRDGITGMVSVSIMVNEQGEVEDAKVVKSSNPGFDQAAIEAVSKWKFKPAKKAGAPVSVKVVVPVKFAMDE